MATTGQTLTKNTSVSIALVALIVGATMWITQAFTSTEARITGLESDINEIKVQQALIIKEFYKMDM